MYSTHTHTHTHVTCALSTGCSGVGNAIGLPTDTSTESLGITHNDGPGGEGVCGGGGEIEWCRDEGESESEG